MSQNSRQAVARKLAARSTVSSFNPAPLLMPDRLEPVAVVAAVASGEQLHSCCHHQLLTVDDTCVNHIGSDSIKMQDTNQPLPQPQQPQQQQPRSLRGCSPTPAVLMDEDCRELLRRHFDCKISKTAGGAAGSEQPRARKKKYELVAAFTVIGGEILSYSVYRERVPFQLTERRRRIIRTYYRTGERNLLLYVNSCEFEHYMPLDHLTATCPHERRLRRRYLEATSEVGGGINEAGRGAIRTMLGRGILPAL